MLNLFLQMETQDIDHIMARYKCSIDEVILQICRPTMYKIESLLYGIFKGRMAANLGFHWGGGGVQYILSCSAHHESEIPHGRGPEPA